MSPVTRTEVNARLQTIEVRMDGRIAAIEHSIATLVSSNKDTQDAIRNLKSTMLWTAGTSVIAIVLGVATFNASLLANMVASFESGRSTTAAQAEVRRQMDETARILRGLQVQLDHQERMKPSPARK